MSDNINATQPPTDPERVLKFYRHLLVYHQESVTLIEQMIKDLEESQEPEGPQVFHRWRRMDSGDSMCIDCALLGSDPLAEWPCNRSGKEPEDDG